MAETPVADASTEAFTLMPDAIGDTNGRSRRKRARHRCRELMLRLETSR